MLQPNITLNCNGQLLVLDKPIVMGILNLTPDSFYDGGKYPTEKAIIQQVQTMLAAGASIIDIGGMSSRPGAAIISEQEELERVLPAIQTIFKHFPKIIISIDTIRSEVARQCVLEGCSIVNDISAGRIDKKMYSTIAQLQVPYILMHMAGKPENMQHQPQYDNVVQEVLDFFIQEVAKLKEWGLKDIILDVGFGFGKSISHNFELLQNMNDFKMLNLPLLAGLSRKSMIYKSLNTTADHALNGTTALNMVALEKGAKILRVHDVKEAVECIKLYQRIRQVRGRER